MGFCCYKWLGILKMGKHAAMHYNSYACILHVLSIETFSYAKCVINMYIMSKGIHICQYIYYNCNSSCKTPKKASQNAMIQTLC